MSSNQRLNIKQRQQEERRYLMTKRRNELTNRIRKQKKSEYLAKRRGLPADASNQTTSIGDNTNAEQFQLLFQSYCQTPSGHHIDQLNNSLAGHMIATTVNEKDNPLGILNQNDKTLAINFLNILKNQVITSSQQEQQQQHNNNHMQENSDKLFRSALQIMVQLTSIQSTYQKDTCTSFLDGDNEYNYYGHQPVTWSDLILSSSDDDNDDNKTTTSLPSWLDIMIQALSFRKEVELTSTLLGNLLGDGVHRVPKQLKPSLIRSLIQVVSTTPAAAWALTNMIRNDTTSYGKTYCSESEGLLSPALLLQWLQVPTIATQTAWMISSLTAREEENVFYLCGHLSFPSNLVYSLQNPVTHDQVCPLVEALGNIACHASMVPPLLTQMNPPLVPILQHILTQTPSRNKTNPQLLNLAAWLTGCLLIDAGVENHPSTTVAAPVLIPILMERIGSGEDNQYGHKISMLTFEEEREFISALWNSLAWPPQLATQSSVFVSSGSQQRSPPAHFQFSLNITRSTIRALVRHVASNDTDAVLSSVHVLDLMLRLQPNVTSSTSHDELLEMMQEEGLVDALEKVCDSPMEDASEVAADILDDCFYNEDQQDDLHEQRPGNYSWMQISTETANIPAFGGEPSSTTETLIFNGSTDTTKGMGRGRGATLPSWMSRN